jgi:uncharacterized protein (TIGR00251 family)
MHGACWYRWENEDLVLSLHVQPRATRDEVLGPAGDHLRVRITAPPVEGRANEHLRRFFAEVFGVPRSHVVLLTGDHGRFKRLRIRGPTRLPDALVPGHTDQSDR